MSWFLKTNDQDWTWWKFLGRGGRLLASWLEREGKRLWRMNRAWAKKEKVCMAENYIMHWYGQENIELYTYKIEYEHTFKKKTL